MQAANSSGRRRSGRSEPIWRFRTLVDVRVCAQVASASSDQSAAGALVAPVNFCRRARRGYVLLSVCHNHDRFEPGKDRPAPLGRSCDAAPVDSGRRRRTLRIPCLSRRVVSAPLCANRLRPPSASANRARRHRRPSGDLLAIDVDGKPYYARRSSRFSAASGRPRHREISRAMSLTSP